MILGFGFCSMVRTVSKDDSRLHAMYHEESNAFIPDALGCISSNGDCVGLASSLDQVTLTAPFSERAELAS